MTEQEYKEAKQILANTPELATHYYSFLSEITYYSFVGSHYRVYDVSEWVDTEYVHETPLYSLLQLKEIVEQAEHIKELERERPPNEQGCNRYGLDMSYFRNVINRELNRPLDNYKPDELARVFARL